MYLEKFPVTGTYGSGHNGVDIGCPTGTPLPAVVDGTVVFEGFIKAAVAGYRDEIIVIVQSNGFFIVYGHLSRTVVNIGQSVKAGEVIGYSGNTGYVLPKPRNNNDLVSGAHLHIEKRLGTKQPNNPLSVYPAADITPLLRDYGRKEAADDMTIIVRPIAMLKINMKKPVQLFDIVTGKGLHNSGLYMEITQVTNVIHGKAYWIPVDRAAKGELLGFWDTDVQKNAEKIHDTQFDLKPQPELSAQDKADLDTGRSFRALLEGVIK